MAILHTFKIKNGNNGALKDLVSDFDFVCLEGGTYPVADQYKELQKNTWYDEDGDDVFIPTRRYLNSFDIEIPVGCEGDRSASGVTAYAKYNTLERYLSGVTTALSQYGMSIYLPKEQIGYNGCVLKEIKDKEYYKLGDYEILTCTIVFTVPNPRDTYFI